MARRRLSGDEARKILDGAIQQEARKEGAQFPVGSPTFGLSVSEIQKEPKVRMESALTRVVAEHHVRNPVRLLTVDVDVRGSGFDGLDVRGAMVRLRPIGMCGTEDVDWAEDKARKLGALTVTRMPLVNCTPVTAEEGPDDQPTAEEPAAERTMEAVMVEHLERLMGHEGCDEQEKRETINLARQMLGEAGG